MSDTTYKVSCPDGKTRTFHQDHLSGGLWHGFVYASNKRVYGTVRPQEAADNAFTPNADSKHRALVLPVEPIVADTEPEIADQVVDAQAADAVQQASAERDDFALPAFTH